MKGMMKLKLLLAVSLILAMAMLGAEKKANGLSVGLGLMDAAGDFGYQATVTSPWLLGDHAAVRLTGIMLFRNGNDWTPYYGIRAGLLGGSFMANAAIRLYGEGGVTLLVPSSEFSDDDYVLGGYGHFGFEFFTNAPGTGLSYYVELGSNGIYAKTNPASGSVLYMNGFATTVGLRLYL